MSDPMDGKIAAMLTTIESQREEIQRLKKYIAANHEHCPHCEYPFMPDRRIARYREALERFEPWMGGYLQRARPQYAQDALIGTAVQHAIEALEEK